MALEGPHEEDDEDSEGDNLNLSQGWVEPGVDQLSFMESESRW